MKRNGKERAIQTGREQIEAALEEHRRELAQMSNEELFKNRAARRREARLKRK